MFDGFAEWLGSHERLAWVIAAVSVFTAVMAVVALPLVIAALPPDYFSAPRRPPARIAAMHPVAHWSFRILKNAIGLVLLVAGLAMLALPGQGVLTIIAGLILVEFPGKRKLERAVVRRPRVLRAMNWVRRKARREPLEGPRG